MSRGIFDFPRLHGIYILDISLVFGDTLNEACPLGNPALHVTAALDVSRRFLDSVVGVNLELDDGAVAVDVFEVGRPVVLIAVPRLSYKS